MQIFFKIPKIKLLKKKKCNYRQYCVFKHISFNLSQKKYKYERERTKKN